MAESGFNEVFREAYKRLNPEQKSAVDTIEGPLMVVAGPGTGKTQILALRICNILIRTDAQAHNILCLTYTDAGAIAMRKRLTEFMGPDAYNIHIYTFHGFCNQVIQENLGLFGGIRELQPLSDLEKVDVFEELIDAIHSESVLKRFKGDPYYERWRLKPLFDAIKNEDWNVPDLIKKADEWVEDRLENDEKLKYSRKATSKGVTYQKGDYKPAAVADLKNRMATFKAAVVEFANYEKLLQEKQRYDYNDMILWVLRELKNNEALLRIYQERYLYFLVDEFQDTNGAQNEVLNILVDYWDEPNVFVVGDDDQSIYRFQGANMQNIENFQKKYQPAVLVLKNNYRSNQDILDGSGSLIKNNKERLVNQLDNLDKELVAAGPNMDLGIKPHILAFQNTALEEAWLFDKIVHFHKNGENLDEIAVIYRNHKQVESLVKALESAGIPLNLRRKVNILDIPFVNQMLFILEYIQAEYEQAGSGEPHLFKLMHLPFLKIEYDDIFKISMHCRYDRETGKKPNWSSVISDQKKLHKIGVAASEEIHKLYKLLSSWIAGLSSFTLQVLFEHVLTDLGMMDHILHAKDMKWKLQLLTTFFDFIKRESTKNPSISLKDFLDIIRKMRNNNISLPFNRILTVESGVHFITGHSSKGLEFEKVFILGATKNQWESKRGANSSYTYPGNLLNTNEENREEEERRLFYVAMTRAKKELSVLYATANADNSNKALEESKFVLEMKDSSGIVFQNQPVSDNAVAKYRIKAMTKTILPEKQLIDKNLINQALENFQLSVTNLNKYLRCPITFYYETILRVPFARSANAGFGSAIHYALEQFFVDQIKNLERSFGSEKLLLEFFLKGMMIYRSHFTDKEFGRLMEFGERILPRFHAKYLPEWHKPKDSKLEYSVRNAHFNGVPVTGVLDKIEIFDDHVNVVDYKTGKPERAASKMKAPKDSDDKGGDYWRQIVFYRILIESDPMNNWRMTSGEMDLVEPDKKDEFRKFKFVIGPADLKIVGEQITDTFAKIKDHQFTEGCEDDRCHWCNFVRENLPITSLVEEEVES